jgi:hypothetical protein
LAKACFPANGLRIRKTLKGNPRLRAATSLSNHEAFAQGGLDPDNRTWKTLSRSRDGNALHIAGRTRLVCRVPECVVQFKLSRVVQS